MTETQNTQNNAVTRRPREDRWIAGVAAGLAERLGVETWIVRAAFILLTFLGGAGIVLYGAGWILIPEEGETQSLAEQWMGRARESGQWIGLALVAVAALILVVQTDLIGSDLAWGIGLLLLGVLLYRGLIPTPSPGTPRDDDSRTEPEAEPPVEAATVADEETVTAEQATITESVEVGLEPASTPAATKSKRSRPPRSILGRLTFGALLVVIGGMVLFDTWDRIDPSFRDYAAVAMGVVGVGLLVGTLFGRSRGLIALGFVMLPVSLASVAVTASFDGGFGNPRYSPTTPAEVAAHYQLTAGDLWIDLTDLDPAGGTVVIEGDVGFGRLLVTVPDGVGIEATSHVGFGDIASYIPRAEGTGLRITSSHESGVDQDHSSTVEGEGLIVLDLDVGFGTIEIREGGLR